MEKINKNKRIQFSFLAGLIFFWGVIAFLIEPNSGNLRFEVNGFSPIQSFETPFYYLCLNLGTFIFPFLLSFDKRVSFFKDWKFVVPAISITAFIFLVWDVYFTATGIWGFNPDYYLKETILWGLPLSEYLFFFTVPYACLFIYKCIEYYFPKDPFEKVISWVLSGLLLLFFLVGAFNLGKAYTASAFILAASLTGIVLFSPYRKKMGLFLKAFFISMIPFLLVNGMLTGFFSAEPVVVYNDLENLGWRIITIPVDDIVYCYSLLLLNSLIYWTLKGSKIEA